jgi:hypothetical protein
MEPEAVSQGSILGTEMLTPTADLHCEVKETGFIQRFVTTDESSLLV